MCPGISLKFIPGVPIGPRTLLNSKRFLMTLTIRDATISDAPFLAKCIMAGMHFYDFETDIPENKDIYDRLVKCEQRKDLLYSYARTRVAELNGKTAGSLLSYPGEYYKELRHRTFTELWPEFFKMDQTSEQEADPGEYYLDTLAVLPEFRRQGIGRSLLEDGIRKGQGLGYNRITLVADHGMPHLIRLYESIGFRKADIRHVFGVEFQRMSFNVENVTFHASSHFCAYS